MSGPPPGTTQMTQDDLVQGGKLADSILAQIDGMRPPAAVAGIAMALAMAAQLAGVHWSPVEKLARGFYFKLKRSKDGGK